ncbi:hypothetical protein ABCW43_16295 [Neorhizobium sp. IRAMC:178]|uniref:hypothetical protein n=1 Tax=Neorhizobium tunisiense TaxID=3144793 RepID=UPI0031F676E1
MKYLLVSASLLFVSPTSSLGAECNFQRPVGACAGRLEIITAGGASPSYTAEVRISSSAKSCSKVEYYLDATPHTTLLRNANTERESLFGTKPISSKSIGGVKCTAYEDATANNSRTTTRESSRRLGGCTRESEAARRLDDYNNTNDSLDGLIAFFPKAIAVHRQLGDAARVAMLSNLFEIAKDCKAKVD